MKWVNHVEHDHYQNQYWNQKLHLTVCQLFTDSYATLHCVSDSMISVLILTLFLTSLCHLASQCYSYSFLNLSWQSYKNLIIRTSTFTLSCCHFYICYCRVAQNLQSYNFDFSHSETHSYTFFLAVVCIKDVRLLLLNYVTM